jgi:hypothetical protein
MQNKKLNFSYNWNNKLNCNYFTTIRLHNPTKYFKTGVYDVFLKEEFKGEAVIIDIKSQLVENMTEYSCGLDTGYSKSEAVEILRRMYPKIDLMSAKFDFILLRKIKQPAKEEKTKTILEWASGS